MPKAGKGRAAQKEAAKKHPAPYSRDKPASDDKSNHSIQDDGKPSRKRRKTKGQDLNAEASSSSSSSKKAKGDEILDQEAAVAETAEAESGSVEPGGSFTQPAMPASTSEAAVVGIEQERSKKSKKDSEHSASPEPKKKKTKHELRELQARFQEAQAAADAAQAELQKKIAELEKTVAEQAAQLETKTTTIDNTNKVGFWWVPTLTTASRIHGRAPQRRQGGSYVWNLHGRHRRASRVSTHTPSNADI